MVHVEIDQKSSLPVYRQVMQEVIRRVKEGELKPGDRLPPERELADSLNISRGTVKKAYGELEKNRIIDVIQGRGSFVAKEQDVIVQSRKDRAVHLIENTLDMLEELKFSQREIQTFIHLLMMKREERTMSFRVCVVDCNPEALSVIVKQLQYISHINITQILLDDLIDSPIQQTGLIEFDVIITTPTHYSELLGLVPNLGDRCLQAVLTPDQQTIIDLASIRSENKLGIICQSTRFKEIIKERLKGFNIPVKDIKNMTMKANSDYRTFLKDRQIIIVPPEGTVIYNREHSAALQEFTNRGGKLIPFNYQIDRGSLIYIEEQISERIKIK
jgi:DNA-binding transcriptional regulator YhcF (GntR family)